jgi:prepilin-type N-terminal cleavage/methylation domain-containing protein
MMNTKRSGFTFVELLAAIAILAVLLTTTVQMLRLVAEQRRRNEDRLAAIEAAASVMELITALPDSQLTSQTLQEPRIHWAMEEIERHWKVDLQVTPATNALAGQRIELRLTRRHAPNREPPLTLTTWRFH